MSRLLRVSNNELLDTRICFALVKSYVIDITSCNSKIILNLGSGYLVYKSLNLSVHDSFFCIIISQIQLQLKYVVNVRYIYQP